MDREAGRENEVVIESRAVAKRYRSEIRSPTSIRCRQSGF